MIRTALHVGLSRLFNGVSIPEWIYPTEAPFATFWHGPLDPITHTCLASFPARGVELRLYTYDLDIPAPPGVRVVDARRIVPDERLTRRYIVDGEASLSKFSNYFRYMLMRKTGCCWVDSDIVCLRKPDFGQDPFVFGFQGKKTDGPWALNGAVLKLPRRHAMLDELLARAAGALDVDTKWGVIGPLLVTEMAAKHDVLGHARPAADFYPIGFSGFWKLLMPERRTEVEKMTANSTFLHLWHEKYRRAGYDKTIAPPEGSYLHDLCGQLGTLDRFRRTYGRNELRAILSAHVRDRPSQRASAKGERS